MNSSSQSFSVWKILLIAVIYVGITTVLLIATSPQPFGVAFAGEAPDTLQRVSVKSVAYEEQYNVTQHFMGIVEPVQRNNVGFELGGTVDSVLVDEGDSVAQGQLLATLDTARLTARKQELLANKKRLQADLRLAKLTLKRLKSAQRVKAVTDQQVDQASGAKDSAEAALGVLSAQVKSLDIELEKSRLKAPYAGTIIRRMVDTGSTIGSGLPVFLLQQSDDLQIRVGVPASMLDKLMLGESYQFKAQDNSIIGTLAALLPGVNETRTVYGLFEIANDATAIRVGSTVSLALEHTISSKGFWIPLNSLKEGRRGIWSLLVALPEKNASDLYHVKRSSVEILYSNGSEAFVNGSLEEGAQVIVDGAFKLVPGQPFKIAESASL